MRTVINSGDSMAGLRPTSLWRQVAVPSEHGGWSLTAEPVVLGLWVVISARAAAAIPHARTMVVRAHGRPVTRWHADLAQVLAVVAVCVVAAEATLDGRAA